MFLKVEDLIVYQRLCDLHLEVCELTRRWPVEEKYELGTQIRRASNSSPAQLAEKHSDRHVRNKEGLHYPALLRDISRAVCGMREEAKRDGTIA